MYLDVSYIFQQDSVMDHTTRTRTTRDFLRENMAKFWTPVDWPLYSQDLNPLDFSLWSILQEKIQLQPHTSLAALHRSISKDWDQLSLAYICQTCRSFRCCLEAIMAKNGA
jgi:hypothetical protein